MRGEEATMPVDVQTRYDQFPATIKGAFVMRGADGNPHAVDLEEARVGRVPQGPSKVIPIEAVRVDVAPGRDLFVPFEVAVSDLESGWYALFSSVRVDAGVSWAFSSRAFSVPWPREAIRRGNTRVDRTIKAGSESFVIEAIDMRADCAVVTWRPEAEDGSTEGASVRLFADDRELESVASRFRPLGDRAQPGPNTRSVFYPIRRGTSRLGLALALTGPAGFESDAIELAIS
jgi:hypothetical protein